MIYSLHQFRWRLFFLLLLLLLPSLSSIFPPLLSSWGYSILLDCFVFFTFSNLADTSQCSIIFHQRFVSFPHCVKCCFQVRMSCLLTLGRRCGIRPSARRPFRIKSSVPLALMQNTTFFSSLCNWRVGIKVSNCLQAGCLTLNMPMWRTDSALDGGLRKSRHETEHQ